MGSKEKKKSISFENISTTVTHISEEEVNNGQIESANELYCKTYQNIDILSPKNQNNRIISKQYSSDEYIPAAPLTLTSLRDYYNNHDRSIDETYDYLINFIKDNINNHEVVQQTISGILDGLNQHYDKKQNGDGAGTTKEILKKCITSGIGSTVSGLICGPIVKTAVEILNDCGIPAGIVPEIYNDRHAILVYKQSDGKYVFNNYDRNIVINANNVKDAISEYGKKEGIIKSPGSIRIMDGNNTYSDYAYIDSAYRGQELSKHTYNKESAFYHNPLETSTGIDANIVTSNLGNISADVTANIAMDNSDISASLGFVKKGESTMFLNSTSVGGKLEYNKVKTEKNTTTFKEIKNITNIVVGKHGGASYGNSNLNITARDNVLADFDKFINSFDLSTFSEEEQEIIRQDISKKRQSISSKMEGYHPTIEPKIEKTVNIATFIKGGFGKNITLKESKNTKYYLCGKLSGDMLYSLDSSKIGNNSGDFRVIAEGGLEAIKNEDKYQIKAGVSGGVFTEYNEQYIKGFDFFSFGTKANADVQFGYKPNSSSAIGVYTSIYDANAASSNNYGITSNLYASTKYKDITFKANCGVEMQQEKIKLGFNEKTEDNITYNIQLSCQKGKTTIYTGAQIHNDNLNSTRSYTGGVIGIRQVL